MEKHQKEWVISQRDGGDRFINSNSMPLTDEEKETLKQKIIKNHAKLCLDENLKYEIFPELFE